MRPSHAEQVLRCTTCGSRFQMDGRVLGGPSTVALERWGIGTDDSGQIVVDLGRRYRHERGEWADPRAFVRR